MPRKPRIEFEGAFYHVLARGNQRQTIFNDESDCRKYLQLLAIYKNRFNYRLYAYVLMNNHVHILIETGDVPLSKILQGIHQSYTMYFNRKNQTVGHLFQGRYKAILCDRDAYLLTLLKYIHYNPVRAGIVTTPDKYLWSSHRAYNRKTKPNGLVDTGQVLSMFSEDKPLGRNLYHDFMNDGETVKKQEIYATIDQRLQGDAAFIERVQQKHHGEVRKELKKEEYSLPEIANAINQYTGVMLEQLRAAGKDKRTMFGRRLFTLAARAYGYKGVEIAEYLQKEPSSITKYAVGENIQTDLDKVFKALRNVEVK